MDTVIIPRVASGFCAFGAALSEVKHDYVSTYTTPLSHLDLGKLNQILSDMEERGERELGEEGVAGGTTEVRRSFEMRYHDQVHNCLVGVDASGTLVADDLVDIRRAFDDRHAELYTYSEPDNEAMLINVHTSVVGNPMSARESEVFRPEILEAAASSEPVRRDVYLGSRRERVPAPIVLPGDVMAASQGIAGPAVVEETTTTIVVDEGWTISLDDRGHYELRRSAR